MQPVSHETLTTHIANFEKENVALKIENQKLMISIDELKECIRAKDTEIQDLQEQLSSHLVVDGQDVKTVTQMEGAEKIFLTLKAKHSDANPNLVQDSEISGPINVVLEDKIKRLTGDVERLTALARNDSNTIKLQQGRIRYLMKKIAKMKGATKIREEILVLEERLEAGRKKNEDELLALQKQRDAVDQKTKEKIQT
ncbi:hypothetical protein D6C82_10327 [Aureobasidium pullulans]|nr:hypothetical protein D6C82_10327 [Aureobasidium pullulans]